MTNNGRSRQSEEAVKKERWKAAAFAIAALVAMVAGMAAKVGYDHFTGTVPFAWASFLVPLMVAPMVYTGVYQLATGTTDTVVMLTLSFQNGFFWQDVLAGLGPPSGG
jgi:hypothetical protein